MSSNAIPIISSKIHLMNPTRRNYKPKKVVLTNPRSGMNEYNKFVYITSIKQISEMK